MVNSKRPSIQKDRAPLGVGKFRGGTGASAQPFARRHDRPKAASSLAPSAFQQLLVVQSELGSDGGSAPGRATEYCTVVHTAPQHLEKAMLDHPHIATNYFTSPSLNLPLGHVLTLFWWYLASGQVTCR